MKISSHDFGYLTNLGPGDMVVCRNCNLTTTGQYILSGGILIECPGLTANVSSNPTPSGNPWTPTAGGLNSYNPNPTPPMTITGFNGNPVGATNSNGIVYLDPPPSYVDFDNKPVDKCECGAYKGIGAKKGDAGHSGWCPWSKK